MNRALTHATSSFRFSTQLSDRISPPIIYNLTTRNIGKNLGYRLGYPGVESSPGGAIHTAVQPRGSLWTVQEGMGASFWAFLQLLSKPLHSEPLHPEPLHSEPLHPEPLHPEPESLEFILPPHSKIR